MGRKIEITPIRYAEIRGCKPQYIHKLLKDGRFDLLGGVLSVKKYSRFYVLVVDESFGNNSFTHIKQQAK